MNNRQAKKRAKYNSLSRACKMRFDFKPKGWSEIRWTLAWIKEHK